MGDILSVLQDFDFSKLLPEPEKYLNSLEGWLRFLVLLLPLVMLGLGLWYHYKPKERKNFQTGMRRHFEKRSPEAWRFARDLAGKAYLLLGGMLSVLMLIISLFFSGKNGLATAVVALICVIIEVLIFAVMWVLIYMLTCRAYDKDGAKK